MKITFTQYILLGIFGVFAIGTTMGRLMQYDTLPYTGRDRTIIFFSKDISQEGKQFGPRIMTLWNISHILYYGLGAYLFPDKAFALWGLGVFWELTEAGFGYMNPMDIMWNTIGIMIGLQAAKKYKKVEAI